MQAGGIVGVRASGFVAMLGGQMGDVGDLSELLNWRGPSLGLISMVPFFGWPYRLIKNS